MNSHPFEPLKTVGFIDALEAVADGESGTAENGVVATDVH